jgi:hypothetical protein
MSLGKIISALVVSLTLCNPVHAQSGTIGTLLQDLWWNPTESGWGVTVTHEADVMFLTFFVYRADNTPYWVTATLLRATPGTGITFPVSYTGDVYETHGSFYGGAFNAGQTSARKVGTATFTASNNTSANLAYSIDGVTVNKQLERQTLRNLNFRGVYLGGILYGLSNCTVASRNGQTVSDTGPLTITQSGTSISLVADGATGRCTFNGTYSQTGQYAYADGSFSCTDGTSGPFSIYGMQWTAYGMSAGLSGRSQFCQFDGAIGGITGNHFLP